MEAVGGTSPTCPKCGDLCPGSEKWSPCCGVWLWHRPPSATELHLRAMIDGRQPDGWHHAAPKYRGEAGSPIKGKGH